MGINMKFENIDDSLDKEKPSECTQESEGTCEYSKEDDYSYQDNFEDLCKSGNSETSTLDKKKDEHDNWDYMELDAETPDNETVEQKARGEMEYNGDPEMNWSNDEIAQADKQLYENDFGAVNEKVFDYSATEYLDEGKLSVNWGKDSVDGSETITIPSGTVLVQYSHEGQSGKYFALEGANYDDLQLPDSQDKRVMSKYVVPEGGIEMDRSEIAIQTWNTTGNNYEIGTGEQQFVSEENANDLVNKGKLSAYEQPE